MHFPVATDMILPDSLPSLNFSSPESYFLDCIENWVTHGLVVNAVTQKSSQRFAIVMKNIISISVYAGNFAMYIESTIRLLSSAISLSIIYPVYLYYYVHDVSEHLTEYMSLSQKILGFTKHVR